MDELDGRTPLPPRDASTHPTSEAVVRPDTSRGEASDRTTDASIVTFLTNVSRELRTPLALMLGPLEQLRRGPAAVLPSRTGEDLALVHRNALRMLRLVNAMREFTTVHGGHTEAFVPTDLPEFSAHVASNFRSLIEKAGLQLVVRCPALPEPVYVDRVMWERIVLHLVANAFEHTFTGEIGVTVRARGKVAELIVRDTGVGIPKEYLPHLFERFHRIPNAKRRTAEGTGNGLALVRELAERHGGTVRIESVVGEGTLVTVAVPFGVAHLPANRLATGDRPRGYGVHTADAPSLVEEMLQWLPRPDTAQEDKGDTETSATDIAERDPSRPSTTAAAAASHNDGQRDASRDASRDTSYDAPRTDPRRERVLIADDNADMRQFLVGLLSPRYDVEAVADGVAALAAIRERTPDLVLSDVMMPKLDGFALLRELRADPRTRAVSIVLVSARVEEESRAEGLDVGADDYLEKPFTARELVARVGSNLRLARMRRELLEQEQRAAAAEAANAAKTQFLTAMSHELRTPLNAITGYVDLMDMELHGPVTAEQRQSLSRIRHSGHHLLSLINDVLDFSQMQIGHVRYVMRDVSVHDVLARIGTLVEPQASKKQITYTYDPCTHETPTVHTDPDRLTQIVLNLLSNAIKFTEPGGRVTLSCTMDHDDAAADSSRVHIHVADTGCGIPAAQRDAVFKPFVQLDRHLVRQSQQGVGLGLAISRDLTQKLGGELTLDSTEGRGSTFTLSLPTVTNAPTPIPH